MTDPWTLDHLAAWVERSLPAEDREAAWTDIITWLGEPGNDELVDRLCLGWPEVYRLAKRDD